MAMKNRGTGKRIKELRLSQGMTQKQLADILNVSQTAVALWENDARAVSWDMIDKIADVLCTSPNYLLFGENESLPLFNIGRGENTERTIELKTKLLERYKNSYNSVLSDIEFLTAEAKNLRIRIDDLAKEIEDLKNLMQ